MGGKKVPLKENLVVVLLIIAGVWLAGALTIYFTIYATDETKSGQLGDSLGIINSLFSALAFGAIIYTIFLQQKELSETREEFKKQNNTLLVQQFENTFFKIFETSKAIISKLEITEYPLDIQTTYRGHRFAERLYERIKFKYKEDEEYDYYETDHAKVNAIVKDVVTACPEVITYMNAQLMVLEYIEQYPIERISIDYFSLLFTSLSEKEKALIFYFAYHYKEDGMIIDTVLRPILQENGLQVYFDSRDVLLDDAHMDAWHEASKKYVDEAGYCESHTTVVD